MADTPQVPVERPNDTFEDVKIQRELQRREIDATQVRDLGVQKEGDAIEEAILKGSSDEDDESDVTVKIPKGSSLTVDGGITLVLKSDVKAAVKGAGTPDAAAATLAANAPLYASVSDQLAHDTDDESVTFGAHGVRNATPKVNSSGETIAPAALTGSPQPGDKPIRNAQEQAEAQRKAAQDAEKRTASGTAKTAAKTTGKKK